MSSSSSSTSTSIPYSNFDLFDGTDFFVDSPQSKEKATSCLVMSSISCLESLGEPSAQRLAALKPSFISPNKKAIATDYRISTELAEKCSVIELIAPSKPFFVLANNFVSSKPLDQLVTSITSLLHDLEEEVDFQFVREECAFHGLYTNNNKRTDFHISIYENGIAGGFIVEMQRVDRDSCCFAFSELYQLIRCKLDDLHPAAMKMSSSEDSFVAEFCPSMESGPSDAEISDSFTQIVVMASSANDQSKLEAVRILSELADDPTMRQPMASAGCINVLARLLSCKNPTIRQHTVMVLAQLSECRVCAAAIVQEEILPKLMTLACNGPYTTAKMRRESTRVISNLAGQFASEMIAVIGKDALQNWLRGVSDLEDKRMHDRCSRAKLYFQEISVGL